MASAAPYLDTPAADIAAPSAKAPAPPSAPVTGKAPPAAGGAGGKPVPMPMAIGALNKLVIEPDMIGIEYQFDIDNPRAKNDLLILKQDQGGYEYTICLGDLTEFALDWVLLEYYGAPHNGTYIPVAFDILAS